MPRQVLDETRLHTALRDTVAHWQEPIVHNVQSASLSNPLLVVGMGGNPFCRRARKALEAAGLPHHYLSFGSYFSRWKERLALKMWTGWPTFPMVFVKGVLIGGATDLDRLLQNGELKRMLGE